MLLGSATWQHGQNLGHPTGFLSVGRRCWNRLAHKWWGYNNKTNLKTHCKSWSGKYFKLKLFELNDNAIRYNYFNNLYDQPNAMPYFDDVDIKNSVNYSYQRRDTTNGDVKRQLRLSDLLDALRWCQRTRTDRWKSK